MNNTMIIEGFICPECQQDMSSIELLQAHFELVHVKKNGINHSPQENNNSDRSTFSSVFAKAKTLISSSSTSTNPFNDYNNEPDNHTTDQSNNNSHHQSPTTAVCLSSNLVAKQYFNLNQANGCFNSHISYFKQIRDQTVGRYVIQTNKLLITLDKLITIDFNVLADETKREAHFKSIVPWIQDIDVKLCPNCAKSFNLLNRKHHCRLCGAIMCNKCSNFLSFSLAKQLTDPDFFMKTFKEREDTEFRLRRSESINSVNSYFFTSSNLNSSAISQSNNNNEQQNKEKKKINLDQTYLRLCMNCSKLLEKKFKSFKEKMIRPAFVTIYDELNTCINESRRIHPIFTKMAESLNSGEAMYQLKNGEEMRLILIKLYQKIETLSAQILNNDVTNTNNDQLKLQRNIRVQSINYLKEYSFTLSQIPTSEVYSKLKAQREIYLQEELKRSELEELKQKNELNKRLKKSKNNTENNNNNIKKKNNPSISIDNNNGWMPTSVKSLLFDKDEYDENDDDGDDDNETVSDGNSDNNSEEVFSDDLDKKSISSQKQKRQLSDKEKALRIQIQLVEKYLEDALKQNKQEEASILRRNLNELLNSLVDK